MTEATGAPPGATDDDATTATTGADDATGVEPAGDGPTTASGRRLRWWREVAYVIAFYMAYSWVRNQFGSAVEGATETAFANAERIIDAQKALGLWFEPSLQQWYLDLPAMGGISEKVAKPMRARPVMKASVDRQTEYRSGIAR